MAKRATTPTHRRRILPSAQSPTAALGAMVAVVLACTAILGMSRAGTAATRSEGPTPLVLVSSRGLQVIAETGTTCTKVYLSTDFVHFHPITPVVPTRPNYAPTCGWYSASFISPSDGWIVGINGGGGPSVLEHTTDGGLTWTREEPQPAEGSESELVGFTSTHDGWSQLMASNANVFVLQHTSNGGASWSSVRGPKGGCPWLPDVFSTPSIGFAAHGLTTAWRTEDGGASWTVLGLPRPRGIPAGAPAIYDAPVFVGLRGTIPVTYLEGTRQIVAFDVTSNGGRNWRLAGVVAVPGAIGLTSRQPTGSCTASVPQTSAPLPLLSASTPGSWWMLRSGPASDSIVLTVAVGHGVKPVGHVSAGLPATAGALLVTLTAADASRAYVGVGNGREVMYQSSDGGAQWTPLPHVTP